MDNAKPPTQKTIALPTGDKQPTIQPLSPASPPVVIIPPPADPVLPKPATVKLEPPKQPTANPPKPDKEPVRKPLVLQAPRRAQPGATPPLDDDSDETPPPQPPPQPGKRLPADMVASVIGLLIGAAVLAVLVRWLVERRRQAIREALEEQMLRYRAIADDNRDKVPIGEMVDASGIPKIRSLNGVVMLSYGWLLCNPDAEETKLASSTQAMLDYGKSLASKPPEDREYYRNVGFAVLIQKILLKQGHLFLSALQDLSAGMTGSSGIKDVINDLVLQDRLDEDQAPPAIARVLNNGLATGQPRTKYIIARALGLLFKEPKGGDVQAPLIRSQAKLYAPLINQEALSAAVSIYPTIYDVYERVVILATPPDSKRPVTKEVADQLVAIGSGSVYISWLLHVKSLPHIPYLPPNLLSKMFLAARGNAFHAAIIDEALSTNLRRWFQAAPRGDNAAVVGLIVSLCSVLPDAPAILPGTTSLLSQSAAQLSAHQHLKEWATAQSWIEEQQAEFRQAIASK